MIDVCIRTEILDSQRLARLGGRLQKQFRFTTGPWSTPHPASPESTVSLYITDRPSHALFLVVKDRGVVVSTWRSVGICHYAHVDPDCYLITCALLGLIQWRALALNPLLRIDDFMHETPSTCLFTPVEVKQEAALLLDDPIICPGCRDFYHCLGVDSELFALYRTLEYIESKRPARETLS